MTTTELNEKLDRIIEKKPAQWKQDAAWRKANRNWLNKSAKIALMVLDRMDELGWNQQKLAQKMGTSQQYISKLCKGQENLTLKNIAQLEEVLKIKLGVVLPYENKEPKLNIIENSYFLKIYLEYQMNWFNEINNNKIWDYKFNLRQKSNMVMQEINGELELSTYV